jgi:glycosyltransferase involved in cell wall biosynthesis
MGKKPGDRTQVEIGIYTDLSNSEKAGIGTYVYYLITNLLKINDSHSYHLINYKKTDIFTDTDEIIIKNPFRHISKTYAWYLYSAIRLNKNSDLDIIHNPSQIPTYFKIRQKSIVTAHDITPLLLPDAFRLGRPLIYKLLTVKTLQNADKIIAVSYSTKRDLLKHLNIQDDRVEVIYEGVDHEKYRVLPDAEVQDIKERYGLDSPFILYVGTLEPRKNIPNLIKAFSKLNKGVNKYKLVIVGKKGWKYDEIYKTVEELDIKRDVIFTGYVLSEDLPKLYNAASLFVYPSLYEGFGLPPLEAMACGTPVITSNTSSLPEVVGNAGIMVNPYNVDDLAEAMREVLTNEGLRQDMIGKGLERAKLFNWEKTAADTLRVYREVSG